MNARTIYTAKYGTIPNGFEIHHLDKDHYNNDIENLIAVSRIDHLKMHKTNDLHISKAIKEKYSQKVRLDRITRAIRFLDQERDDHIQSLLNQSGASAIWPLIGCLLAGLALAGCYAVDFMNLINLIK